MRIVQTLLAICFVVFLTQCAEKAPAAVASVSADTPPQLPVRSSQLACDSLLSTFMWEDPQRKGQLVAEARKGTDKLAIEVGEQKMSFTTRAAVEVGFARPAEFTIVSNNPEYLAATFLDEDGPSVAMDSFILNKKSGLAVWTKSRGSTFVISERPDVQSFYLWCK